MPIKPAHPGANSLLAGLTADLQSRFLGRATSVQLSAGKILYDSEQPINEVFFPVTAVLSVLSVMTDRAGIEAAVIGHEGMAPLGAFHQTPSEPEQIVVQMPGEALRMTRDEFHAAMAEVPAARSRLHRFSQALFTFAAQTSGCNRHHSVVERCARWLLLAHDRATSDELPLTQLFMSRMLGVRRSSVTVAAEVLRAAGAIDYTRGRIRITNRTMLRERSCDCYAIIRSTYDRLMEGKNTPSPLEGLAAVAESIAIEEDIKTTGDFSVPPEQTLQEFSAKLRGAQKRNEALRAELTESRGDKRVLALTEELSMALEQLQVAEEELRVQMEAVNELRIAVEMTHQQWRARFDGLPDAYIETDQYDSIIEVNRAAEDLIGAHRAALIGKPLASIVLNTDRRSLRDVMQKLKEESGGARWSGTLSGTRAGELVDVTAAVQATRAGGEPLMVVDGKNARGRYIGARWLVRRKSATH